MQESQPYLFGGEEVALVVRPHPVVLAEPLAPVVAAVALSAAVTNPVTMGLLAFITTRFLWHLGLWWVDRYILTSDRILSTSGLLTKTVTSMPLVKITDLTYTRSPLGRILGYGSLHLESAGQAGLERVDFLPDPDDFYRAVMSLALGPPGGKTPAAEPAQPEAPAIDLDAEAAKSTEVAQSERGIRYDD